MPPASVTIDKAVRMDVPVIITTFGNTQEQIGVEVIPQVSGILLKNLINDGATVKAGQPLFEIDTSDYALRVKQAESVVNADKLNLKLANLTLERNKALVDKKLISDENFDNIKTKAESVGAQVQMDEAQLEQAQLNLSRCTIKSPIDGVCSKCNVDEGNLVAAGVSRLTSIRNYDPIRAEFSVSDQFLPAIRKAMEAGNVKIEVKPRGSEERFTGSLKFIDNTVNPLTGTILMRGEVPNPGNKLWANQFVYVDIIAGIETGAVMVPESAVQFGKNGTYLYTVTKDNTAEMRPVKTGLRYNKMIQIKEGLSDGDPVVVMGQFMLYPGAQVMDLSKMPPPGSQPPQADKNDGKGQTK